MENNRAPYHEDEAVSRNHWATPELLASNLVDEYGLVIDVCTFKETAKCKRFFTESDNGLKKRWDANVWCNPPYDDILPWTIRGAIHPLITSVFLLPMRSCSDWFCLATNDRRVGWYTFDNRIKFVPPQKIDASQPRHDSCLIVFNDKNGSGYLGQRCRMTGRRLC